jgi:hypothetical protein
MMAKPELKGDNLSLFGITTPTQAAEKLCSHCLRPLYGELDYICEACGANHYVNEFYICCPVDSEKPLIPE